MRRNITNKLMASCVVIIFYLMLYFLLTGSLYQIYVLVRGMYANDVANTFQARIRNELRELKPSNASAFFSAPKNVERTKIDWHDYRFMEEERKRTGIGEMGKPAHLKPEDEAERKRILALNGFNGYLSDKISLNRSVADIRHKKYVLRAMTGQWRIC